MVLGKSFQPMKLVGVLEWFTFRWFFKFYEWIFHRLKPNDFKLASTYGVPKDSNIVDWAISYEELEPYYTKKVEEVVGISGKVQEYAFFRAKSTKRFSLSH